IVMPISTESATVLVPTRAEMRAPYRIRLRMSRPSLSVPKRCSPEEGRRSCSSFCSVGLWGAIRGASAARPSSAARIMTPARSNRLSAIAHPRIHQAIENVGQEVHHEIRRGDDQDAPLSQRIVPGLDRLDGKTPDPRPGEDGLRNDRARQQGAELESQNGNDRQKRIAQRMLQPDFPLALSLGAGGADIVFVDGRSEERR